MLTCAMYVDAITLHRLWTMLSCSSSWGPKSWTLQGGRSTTALTTSKATWQTPSSTTSVRVCFLSIQVPTLNFGEKLKLFIQLRQRISSAIKITWMSSGNKGGKRKRSKEVGYCVCLPILRSFSSRSQQRTDLCLSIAVQHC